MTEQTQRPFSAKERETLHSVAEMFSQKDDRDELRQLINEGATLREITMAYRTNRRLIAILKTVGGAVAALKSLNFWPK